MSWSPAVVLLASSVAALALAPIVPDEPLRLSGVMVVCGIALAVGAFVAGLLQLTSPDPESRSSGKAVMLFSAVAILATAAVLIARLMAQFS